MAAAHAWVSLFGCGIHSTFLHDTRCLDAAVRSDRCSSDNTLQLVSLSPACIASPAASVTFLPIRRHGDRSRSRERGYDHSYGRAERDREAQYDQYAAFGGYGYAGYGMYPAAPYGVPVPGLLGDSCFVCGGIGHIALDCPSRETLQRGRVGPARMSREQEVEKCFECGKQGHQAREVRRGRGEMGSGLRSQVLGLARGLRLLGGSPLPVL